MGRDEYLQKANEGFIKDKIKKGWNKVKSFFGILFGKIKDFIAVFDTEGNILPVVSPAAVIDKFADSSAVKVYASEGLSQVAVEAGGKGCEEQAPLGDESDVYDGDAEKGSPEYNNFLKFAAVVKESINQDNNQENVNESWDEIVKERVPYGNNPEKNREMGVIPEIDMEEFEEILNDMIDRRITFADDLTDEEKGRNILVFGAPGIGKSTIPNMVVKKYNESVNGDKSKMISLINVNCALLKSGDLLMPTMPKPVDVLDAIQTYGETFKDEVDKFEQMSDEEKNRLSKMMRLNTQYKADDTPKAWLPAFKPTGDKDADDKYGAYANGGVYKVSENEFVKTGNGGIIIFDELLRADEDIFGDLMNFLLFRQLHEYVLGSKWIIIACSNRPCDDDEIAEAWNTWNNAVAGKDRFASFCQLIPDPESWKKWATDKGFDPILIDFIFEKSSMAGNEYPRWHTGVKNGVGESYQNAPVTPRRWADVLTEIKTFIKLHNMKAKSDEEKISDISQMSMKDIKRCIRLKFDKDFTEEIMRWLEDHMDKIDLDRIMTDPENVPFPAKFANDPEKAVSLVEILNKEFETKFKDDPSEVTDEMMKNIFIWLGINFKGDLPNVQRFVNTCTDKVFTSKSGVSFNQFVKAMQVLCAAYPLKGMEKDMIEKAINETDPKKYPWPKDSMDTIIELMKKYFPWRIKGDEILYYDSVDLD